VLKGHGRAADTSGVTWDGIDDAHAVAVIDEMKRTKAIVPPTLRKSFTVRYTFALTLVALLSIGAGLSALRIVDAQSDSAAEVNIAGRQRMLSQRIALLSDMYIEAEGLDRDAVEATLRSAISTMVRSQEALLAGNPSFGLDGTPSERVQALYDEGVAADVVLFTDDATRLVDGGDGPVANAALVRSLQAEAAGPLILKLDAVVTAYQVESEEKIAEIANEEKIVLAATLVALLLEAAFVFRPMSRQITFETDRLKAAATRHQIEAARHEFGIRLRDAVELADTESELIDTVETAVGASEVPGEFEFLQTDPDEPTAIRSASFAQLAADHHCSVVTADGCPAMRRGRPLQFDNSEELGACRHLRDDARRIGEGPVSGTCIPVTFRGSSIGVLRSVDEVNASIDPSQLETLSNIAVTAGTHIGTLRAFAASRSDAEHDSLTGLLNRRGVDAAVEELMASNVRYVVAIADLDHFKEINDTHGHDAGDAALLESARIMKSVLRPDDVLGRHGGEEFLVVIPIEEHRPTDGDLAAGVSVAERIRKALEAAQSTGRLPLCTVSIGVAAASANLEEAVQNADTALYRAKANGRNRVEVEGDLLTGLDAMIGASSRTATLPIDFPDRRATQQRSTSTPPADEEKSQRPAVGEQRGPA